MKKIINKIMMAGVLSFLLPLSSFPVATATPSKA